MDFLNLLLKTTKPAFARAASVDLSGLLSPEGIREVVKGAGRHWDAQMATLPAEPTLGARTMARLAAATVGSFRALRDAGLDEDLAVEKTAAINWKLYRRQAAPPWLLAGLSTRDPLKRVRRTMGLLMLFPYSFSGYDMRWAETDSQTVGFDVHRCPAAEYFQGQGLARLGKTAFCDLDYPLAQEWGLLLSRPQTLMAGDAFCDFRFSPASR